MPNNPTTQSEAGAPASPLVAIDLVLMTLEQGRLCVMMSDGHAEGVTQGAVLPGALVGMSESLDEAAKRVLRDRAYLTHIDVEQFHAFGAVDRDPRKRSVSIGFLALVPYDRLEAAAAHDEHLLLAPIGFSEDGSFAGLNGLATGFDHADIIGRALERIREKLNWSTISFGLLPEQFTLLELQKVHEAILGRTLNKPAFRKRLLDAEFPGGLHLTATGQFTSGRAYRPAELYQLKA